jgi:levanase/fructan beta-fructosidase
VEVDARRWGGRREAQLPDAMGALHLRVLVDRCSVEVFTGDGAATLTELVFPSDSSRGVRVAVRGGTQAANLVVWALRATAVG